MDVLFHIYDKCHIILEHDALIFTEHTRPNGQIFCSHPSYRGGTSWYDWVIVQWSDGAGGNQFYLAQILCFVDLQDVKVNESYESGLYGVVHSSKTPLNNLNDIDQIISRHKMPNRKENGA